MRVKIAVFGTGYWARFQIPAWQACGATVTAVWNRTREKAEMIAEDFHIPDVYESAEDVFRYADFDIADIIADPSVHEELVLMAARYGKDVICQKPMAPTLEACQRMVGACDKAGVWFAVHENFRYQPQFDIVKNILAKNTLGQINRAHLVLRSPDRAIMDSQPALKDMDHMALRDMGPHIFDCARMLFGEVQSVLSKPIKSYPDIDVVDMSLQYLEMESGLVLACDLVHHFPYKLFIEADNGTLELQADNKVIVDTGLKQEVFTPDLSNQMPYIPKEDWDLHGAHVFLSIPRCLNDLLDAWQKRRLAQTSGQDNLKTLAVVFKAIESQELNRTVYL